MKNLESLPLPGGLYIVSTPIGNLRDITLRALDVLRGADLIVCEDTRVGGKLLEAYDIRGKKMVSYNDHNADQRRAVVIAAITAGQAVALTSDAGTPLISDPGYKLVRDCLDLGLPVIPVPGANAVLPALQLSGLPPDAFLFAGFLPPKSAARRQALAELAQVPATLTFYESAPRIKATLTDMIAVFGDREGAIAREITKRFEQSRRGRLSVLLAGVESDPPRGEIVVMVARAPEGAASAEDIEIQLKEALGRMSVKDAAALIAAATGEPRKEIYEKALQISRALGQK